MILEMLQNWLGACVQTAWWVHVLSNLRKKRTLASFLKSNRCVVLKHLDFTSHSENQRPWESLIVNFRVSMKLLFQLSKWNMNTNKIPVPDSLVLWDQNLYKGKWLYSAWPIKSGIKWYNCLIPYYISKLSRLPALWPSDHAFSGFKTYSRTHSHWCFLL